jgi:hypothetical protein
MHRCSTRTDSHVKQPAGMSRHSRALLASELVADPALEHRGRREGRAPFAPMVACKKARGSRHRYEPNIRPPLRDVLRLIRDLPGDRRSCPRHPPRHAASLASAPGCQDHTTSPSVPATLVRRSLHVHRSPPLRIVTTRTPLFDEAGWRHESTVSEKTKQIYFSGSVLTGYRRLMSWAKCGVRPTVGSAEMKWCPRGQAGLRLVYLLSFLSRPGMSARSENRK